MEERRTASLEVILVELGQIKQSIDTISGRVDKNNGRTGRLETRMSFIFGGLAVIAIGIVPIFVEVMSGILNGK